MNYANLKKYDVADGPGVRVSLFVSGCRRHCRFCQNEETWDFAYGRPYTSGTEKEIMEALAPKYIAGLTLLGGEPFENENAGILAGLVRRVREEFPQKPIWAYSGFTFEALSGGSRQQQELLAGVDVLVDGAYIEEQKDITLIFRGSSNQRILDVRKSLDLGRAVLLDKYRERGH